MNSLCSSRWPGTLGALQCCDYKSVPTYFPQMFISELMFHYFFIAFSHVFQKHILHIVVLNPGNQSLMSSEVRIFLLTYIMLEACFIMYIELLLKNSEGESSGIITKAL